MLLLADIGNTQTVIGVFKGAGDSSTPGDYLDIWRISTDKKDTADDLRCKLIPLLTASGIEVNGIHHAAIASVVPSLNVSWAHVVQKIWNVEATFCRAESAHAYGLFDADYPNPHEIGSDRVADAIAARAFYGDPVVVVDFGTATNIEVIDARGCFVGGVIAPGITTGADALFSNATQIASTGVAAPHSVIGTSTSEAVRSGVIYGEVGRVDGLLRMIFNEIGCTCPVVATGGLVHTVSRLSECITHVRPELTLDGLRILAERANNALGGMSAVEAQQCS